MAGHVPPPSQPPHRRSLPFSSSASESPVLDPSGQTFVSSSSLNPSNTIDARAPEHSTHTSPNYIPDTRDSPSHRVLAIDEEDLDLAESAPLIPSHTSDRKTAVGAETPGDGSTQLDSEEADSTAGSASADEQMVRTRSSGAKKNGSIKRKPSAQSLRHQNGSSNGHADGANAANASSTTQHSMLNAGGSALEHRRVRQASLDSDDDNARESATASLIQRSSFTLDDPVPSLPGDGGSSSKGRGLMELPEQDRRNFFLLVLLYFLQGLPMGLAMGSVPFLLKQHVSYAQMGVFSLASYPYSLKLLWSPIVDAVWSKRFGRRKSWILPIQFLSSLSMLWLAGQVTNMIDHAGDNDGANVWGFTWWWFALVFLCATQDIAVDGWALTLLSTDNLSYASTAQTVGLTAGQFLSSTIFLAFNSKDFANKWFRTVPLETGLISLSTVLSACGWLYLIVTIGLAVLKREDLARNEEGVWDTYKVMLGILKLRNVQSLIIVHLIAKIGFQANDGATTLKLLDKGFGQDNLALTVLVDFPFEIGLGYYVGKWSSQYGAMRLWSWGFVGRLGAAALAQFVVWSFPRNGVNLGYLLLVIVGHVLSTFMNTVMFVAVSAFHAKISDPVYGGTYMTLLATVTNFGGTFPKFFVLKLIDILTVATCSPPTTAAADLKGPLITESFSCVAEADKHRCSEGGGTCTTTTDGFYAVNVLCIVFGTATFVWYIRPTVKALQALPVKAWRLAVS